METIFKRFWEFLVAIVLAVHAVIHSIFGIPSIFFSEGFVPNIAGSHLSEYSLNDLPAVGNGRGGDDRFKMFHPYLRQTEYSSHEQRDNHKWPTGREMAGSMEQSLSLEPVLPCYFPKTNGKNLPASRF